jgi:hypothetical protein
LSILHFMLLDETIYFDIIEVGIENKLSGKRGCQAIQ